MTSSAVFFFTSSASMQTFGLFRNVQPSVAIAALFLNNKGRIVDDVIISRDNGDILVECSASNRENLKKYLEKYRMRKSVS